MKNIGLTIVLALLFLGAGYFLFTGAWLSGIILFLGGLIVLGKSKA